VRTLRYVFLASILSASGIASAAPWYTATAIGPAGSVPYAINNAGDMVGYAGLNAFIYSSGSYQTYSVPGSSSTWFDGINNNGLIVGSYGNGGGQALSFRLSNGVLSPYTLPAGSSGSRVYDVNDAGDMVGLNVHGGKYKAYLDQGGVSTELAPAPEQTVASGINNAGTIVGYSVDSASNSQAVVFENGGVTAIGGFSGGSRASAVSEDGKIGGEFIAGPLNQGVFVWDGGGSSTLYSVAGRVLYLHGINSVGQAVGDGWINGSPDHNGYLYADGTATVLNTRLVGDTNWDIYSANDINESGQIAAFGCYVPTGVCQALRLDISPVPEPASWAMLLAGLAAVGYGIRRNS
jgi:probable HAF family extracellular repeat protein